MQTTDFKITANKAITKDVYELTLSGNLPDITPGQFVNIKIPGCYLRRPISISNWDNEAGTITLIYKVVGEGTEILSRKKPNHSLELLLPLGNGFDTKLTTENTLLCGGGVGVPPLIGLAKKMLVEGKSPEVVLGFNTKDEIFGVEKFQALGLEPRITTVDGSFGIKGFIIDALKTVNFDYVCSCGPVAMLKAIYSFVPQENAASRGGALEKNSEIGGQYSFEARMACGFGACMGCTCMTKEGYKRICKEGPVLLKEEILW
ncbi:dihydroorotate dehydrogenase electron transfer subunit [Peptostreptococcaceae bacterium pGA-8]|nr:dihydroorotate dehydrogenase electron transfer subunit [Peptostreptococcaceae bacterium pGA-8]